MERDRSTWEKRMGEDEKIFIIEEINEKRARVSMKGSIFPNYICSNPSIIGIVPTHEVSMYYFSLLLQSLQSFILSLARQ